MLRLLSLVATKSYNRVTRHVISLTPSIVARSFHTNLSCRSNCDFGSPCNCTECTENAKRPICEVCEVRPTVNQSSKWSRDRKGISYYAFTSFCEQCYTEENRKREREKEQTLAFAAFRKEKMEKMMRYVRGFHSTEQVPIGYAVERLLSDIRSAKNFCNSQRWYRRHLVDHLSQDLQIVKVRNRYMCNKRRVDAMDFKLWFFHQ
jgi:hypothetical protein